MNTLVLVVLVVAPFALLGGLVMLAVVTLGSTHRK
jgi:hypothetical protein